MTLNPNIKIIDKRNHKKASEEYLNVEYYYPNGLVWKGWVPIVYRRTGLFLRTKNEIIDYLNDLYPQLNPLKREQWIKEQELFWSEKPNADITKSFFDALSSCNWTCVNCGLPKNPNWARRIQDIKEFGYTIATDTNKFCKNCGENKTHLILLPIKRLSIKGNGYETWSPQLRKRIIKLLGSIDVYEGTYNANCLPDHKFSEIRWDENTKEENPDDMSDEEIKEKFQLLTNQRNQQKREICRNCFQTGKRGVIYGIPYYYKGNENWDERIPKIGKQAEKGCIGCPWYDIQKWKEHLIDKLIKENSNDEH